MERGECKIRIEIRTAPEDLCESIQGQKNKGKGRFVGEGIMASIRSGQIDTFAGAEADLGESLC